MKGSSPALDIPSINGQISHSRICDTPIPTSAVVANNSSSLKLSDTSQEPQASSFAAALRSLAKNASNANVSNVKISSELTTSLSSCSSTSKEGNVSHSPSLPNVLGSDDMMPTNPGVSASLLDVRKVNFQSHLFLMVLSLCILLEIDIGKKSGIY